jgi:hypothetical protein
MGAISTTEDNMIRKFTIAGGAIFAIALALAPQTAPATTIGPHTPIPPAVAADDSLVQLAQYGYCRAWRRECAERWGWRTPRYYACLERRGCLRD